MTTHIIEVDQESFEAYVQGTKKFLVKKIDKDYQLGDALLLQEVDENSHFTGRTFNCKVCYKQLLTKELEEARMVMSVFGGFMTTEEASPQKLIAAAPAKEQRKNRCPQCWIALSSNIISGKETLHCNNCNQHYQLTEHGEVLAVQI